MVVLMKLLVYLCSVLPEVPCEAFPKFVYGMPCFSLSDYIRRSHEVLQRINALGTFF